MSANTPIFYVDPPPSQHNFYGGRGGGWRLAGALTSASKHFCVEKKPLLLQLYGKKDP